MSVHWRQCCYRLLRCGYLTSQANSYSTKLRSFRHVHLASCVLKEERPGHTRYLKDPNDTWKYNNWDDAEWDEEQEEQAKLKVLENSSDLVPDDMREKYEAEADNFWDQFYSQHQNRFFKDRHWLFVQFPELAPKDYNLNQENTSGNASNDTETPSATTNDTSSGTTSNQENQTSVASTPNTNASTLDTSAGKILVQGIQGGESISTVSTPNANTNASLSDTTSAGKILIEGIQGDESASISPEEAKKLLDKAKVDTSLTEQDKHDHVCQGVQGDVVVDWSAGSEGSVTEGAFPGEHGKFRIFEVGCGVGNTVFPVLQTNKDPDLFVYCCDLSETAIQIIREHEEYEPKRCHAFVGDVTDLDKPLPFPEESLDAVILIFVLSAIHPDKMQATMNRLVRCLKPGGMILFRDYGRYDMVQLRFKSGKCLSPNFYVRGDGTRVYFFTQDELRTMFTNAGLTEEVQNFQDRRLQVNRGRQLKMYRVWIQCKYRKPMNT